MSHILAIDQGTTSTRAIIFDGNVQPVATRQQEFEQIYPQSGWVEHDPTALLKTTLECSRQVMDDQGLAAKDIAAIGITNQRETTLVWDKSTGECVYNAIVWQDRRTATICDVLKEEGHEALFTARTGLLLDPYFSATKLQWILDNVDGARQRAERGELLFGTVDSFLIWHLSEGKAHVTDATNAARTMLYNIHKGCWDEDICKMLNIPMDILPDVRDCAADFAKATLLGGSVPIAGVAGDQQAATIGQACFQPGMMKSTYGTGCFALLNTGDKAVQSNNRLLTTIAYRLNGKTTYALEGSIFIAGAVVQWLRDGLGIIDNAAVTEAMAKEADVEQDLYIVPAFTGLGAPYWDAQCRGAVYGLTRNSGPNEFARAALESVGYQTRDLLMAMGADGADISLSVLRVDGGMTASNWTMQFLSDILGAPVDRPSILETTVLGAAWLAGMREGVYGGPEEFANSWSLDRRFEPNMKPDTRKARYRGWQDAVKRTLTHP